MKTFKFSTCLKQQQVEAAVGLIVAFLLAAGLSGCTSAPRPSDAVLSTEPSQVASPDAVSIPATADPGIAAESVAYDVEVMSWVSYGNGYTFVNDVGFAWHAVVMGEDFVDVVYSLSGDATAGLTAEARPQNPRLRVNDDTVLPAIDVVPLIDLQGAVLGVLRFPGRSADSKSLQVEIDGISADRETLTGVWQLPLLHNVAPAADRLQRLYLIPGPIRSQAGWPVVSLDSFRSLGYLQPSTVESGLLPASASTPGRDDVAPTPLASLPSPDTAVDDLVLRVSGQSTDRDHLVAFDITAEGDAINIVRWDEDAPEQVDDGAAPPLADDGPFTDSTVSLEKAKELFPHPLALPSAPPFGASLAQVDYLELKSEGDIVYVVGLTYDNGLKIVQQTIPPGRDPDQIVPAAPHLTQSTQVNGIPAKGNDAGVSDLPERTVPVPGQIYWHDGDVFYIIFGEGFSLEALRAVAETVKSASS